MKTKNSFLSAIFFLAMNMAAFGQNYQSIFGSQSTSWNVTFGYCDAQITITNNVLGDTVINSMHYKKVDGSIVFSNSAGYLREDTVLGKAWYYNKADSTEYLTMDLGLNMNDTFDIYDNNNVPYHYCVDSIYYLNSRKHVQLNADINICMSHGKVTFIEGVGSTAGLFFQGYQPVSIPFYMLCQHKNGIKSASSIIYPDTCFVQSIGIIVNKIKENSIKVFPVPVSTELTIDLNTTANKSYEISVFNLRGDLVLKSVIKNNSNILNVSELQNGVYQILIENGSEVKYSRFIKN